MTQTGALHGSSQPRNRKRRGKREPRKEAPELAAPQAQAKPGAVDEAATVVEAPPRVTITLTHDQIAERARQIWLEKGRPIGLDQVNWHEAEQQLREEAARAASDESTDA